jgi:gliding motility-associated-like protein
METKTNMFAFYRPIQKVALSSLVIVKSSLHSALLTRTLFYLVLFHLCAPLSSRANTHDSLYREATLTLSVISTGTTCNKNNGSILATAANGIPPYSYVITGHSPRTDGRFLYLIAGTYVLTVTDAVNATATSTVTLTNTFMAPTGVTTQFILPSSCDSRDGSFTLTGIGGTAPYTYSIDRSSYQPGNHFANLTSGLYYAAVKDVNGCTSPYIWWDYREIPERCPIQKNGLNLSNTCSPFKGWLGLLNVSGGTPPYLYSLDGNNFQAEHEFYPVPAGLYTVTVKDAAGKKLLYSVAIVDRCNDALSIAGTVEPATCGLNGSITLLPTDGISPYLYSLDGVNFQSSNQFNGLIPGTYTATVKDAGTRSATHLFVVSNSCISIDAQAKDALCGQPNGSIEVVASQGKTPYLYSIDGIRFQTAAKFTDLAAGNYTLTVKDAENQSRSITVMVKGQPGPLLEDLITTATGCDNVSGTVIASAKGGLLPVLYSFHNGAFQSNPHFTKLPRGTYSLQVKDANGCMDSKPVVIGLNNNLLLDAGSPVSICEGSSVQLAIQSNGTHFSWSPANGLNNNTIQQPQASPAVSTTYMITAQSGICTVTRQVPITVYPLPVAATGVDQVTCIGNDVVLYGSGGVTYLWSPSSYLDNPHHANPIVRAPQGTFQYTLQVKDQNGCISKPSIPVNVRFYTPVIHAGNDTIQLSNRPITLRAGDIHNTGFSHYQWSPTTGLSDPSLPNPVLITDHDVRYTVTARTPDGCTATDDILIKIVHKVDIFVPNAFTPNGDGRNDVLKAIPVGIKDFKRFVVFNRWGEIVFTTSDPAQGWNGTYRNHLQSGLFVWIAEGVDFNGQSIQRKGTTTIVH